MSWEEHFATLKKSFTLCLIQATPWLPNAFQVSHLAALASWQDLSFSKIAVASDLLPSHRAEALQEAREEASCSRGFLVQNSTSFSAALQLEEQGRATCHGEQAGFQVVCSVALKKGKLNGRNWIDKATSSLLTKLQSAFHDNLLGMLSQYTVVQTFPQFAVMPYQKKPQKPKTPPTHTPKRTTEKQIEEKGSDLDFVIKIVLFSIFIGFVSIFFNNLGAFFFFLIYFSFS